MHSGREISDTAAQDRPSRPERSRQLTRSSAVCRHLLFSGALGIILVAKSNKFGGDIVVVKLNKDGTVKSVEPFITGFLQNNSYIGRPVDLHVMKDGSVLFSDDWNGAVYRVTYGGGPVAHR